MRRPSGHSPKPDATLMWPQAPMLMSCAPQAAAKVRARPAVMYGSFVLAITIEGKGSGRLGTPAKLPSHSGMAGDASISAGATSMAPAAGRCG